MDDLQRLIEILPHERRAQRRVAVNRLLQCAREALSVQLPSQAEGQLRHVHGGLRRIEAMKEQSLLRR